MKQARTQQGFTLIEILVVILIMGIIFTYVLTTLTSTLDAVKSSEERMEIEQAGRFIIRRITQDLACASDFPLSHTGRFVGRSRVRDGQRMDELHFTSFTGLYLSGDNPTIHQSEVGWYFSLPQEAGNTLLRRESPVIDERVDVGGIAFAVTGKVKGFKVSYYSGSSYQGWVDDWDSSDVTWSASGKPRGMPQSVAVELTLAKGEREYFFSTVVDIPS